MTLPPALYPLATTRKGRKTLEGWAVALVSAWLVNWSWRGHQVAIGGSMSWHPEREKHPGRWSPHLNMLIPLRGLDDSGKLTTGRYWLPDEALTQLHRLWTCALRFCGYAGPDLVQIEKRFYPRRSDAKRRDRDPRAGAARYYHRPFPHWKPTITRIRYWGNVTRWIDAGVAPISWPKIPSPCFVCATCGGPMRHVLPLNTS